MMKYVALSKFLFIFYVGSSLTWPNHKSYDMIYENGYQVRLSKMSKVCTVIAETCMKCTRLKACFWCGDNGEGQAGCYADNDLIAKRQCYGFKSSYWDEKQCVDVVSERPHGDFYAPPPHRDNIKKNVLVKLLLLLTTLKDGKEKNEITQIEKQRQQPQKVVVVPPSHQNEKNRINIDATTIKSEVVTMTTKNTAVVSNSMLLAIDDINDFERYNDENKSNILVRVNKDKVLHTLKVTAVTTTSIQNTMENITTQYTLKNNTTKPFVDKSNQTLLENIPHTSISSIVGVRSTSVLPCTGFNNDCKGSSVKPTVKVFLSHITFMKEMDVCQKRSNCEECVTRSNCYWCDTADSSPSSCSLYPGKSYVKAECKGNIKHKTCSQEIPVFIFALCIILVTFFLSVGYLCARKCYYFQRKPVEVKLEERPILFKQKNGRTVYQITESEEDEEEKLFQVGKDSYTRNKVGAAPNNPAVW